MTMKILILCIFSVLQKSFYDIEKMATNKSKIIFFIFMSNYLKKVKIYDKIA